MFRKLGRSLLLAGLCLAAVSVWAAEPVAPAPTLKVGSAAPAVVVEKWIKGTPLAGFKAGQVYVVEFWATWCGPCIVGMPHLSELQKKYGEKVSVNGISIWEANHQSDVSKPTLPKVEAFVREAREMMAYNVGAGGKAMEESWMKAAGKSGIPCAFVVNGQGKIAWVGHPLMGLQDVLDLVVQDKFTEKAAKRVEDVWEFNMSKYAEVQQDLQKDIEGGKFAAALPKVEELFEIAPFAASSVAGTKYVILTHTDPAAAAAYGQGLLKAHGNAPVLLYSVAGEILDAKSKAATRDYGLAVKLMEQAMESMTSVPALTERMAEAYFRAGDTANAVKTQTNLVKQMMDEGAKEQEITEAMKKLAEYKAKTN